MRCAKPMTLREDPHRALLQLTFDEVRQRGANARRLTLPFFSNPFHRRNDLPFEEWVARCSAWSAGWIQEDAGRTESLKRLLRLRLW
jgi:hypothetical protein